MTKLDIYLSVDELVLVTRREYIFNSFVATHNTCCNNICDVLETSTWHNAKI